MDTISPPVGFGNADGMISADNYKRAVYLPPPSKFTVEMLGAVKQGGNHSYGMRISPIARGDRASVSSRGSHTEYEVWRRWEDCLWFQSVLELEYQRMAKAKRQRLLRGKGVKKDGFYKQDFASSFESLPPGPDPNSVARDIHEYIPMLTKRATVFFASQATIDQRAAELETVIEALFQPDLPALVDELRRSRTVTDFFGFWRRDYDLAEKQGARTPKPRNSITSSVFHMYFSASSPNIADQPKIPEARPPSKLRPPRIVVSAARPRKESTDSSDQSPSRPSRPRASSTASSDFSSAHSDRSLDSPVDTSTPAIADDSPVITFDHNPLRRSDPQTYERASSSLASLPEEREASLKESPSERRRKVRSGRIFLSPHDKSLQQSTTNESQISMPSDRAIRESWQTMDSAACVLEGIDISLSTPTEFSHRESMSSISTVMTSCSADAVIPRTPEASPPRKRNTRPRVSGPVSISEFDDDVWSDPEDSHFSSSRLADSFPLPCFDLPNVIIHNRPQTVIRTHDEQRTPPASHSPTTSFSSLTTCGSLAAEKLSIKAGYNDSMVILRVPWDIAYKDVRQRLYNKFVGQEGVPLSDSFTITYLQPVHGNPLACKSSDDSETTSTTFHQEHLVTSQADWENVTTSIEGFKLTLRIADNIPSP